VIFSLIAVLVLIGVVSWLNPHIKNAIRTHTPIYEKVEGYARGFVQNRLEDLVSKPAATQSVILQAEGQAEAFSKQDAPGDMAQMAEMTSEVPAYMTQTAGMDPETIRKYAESRGIDEETIKKYADERGMTEEEVIREYAKKHGVNEDQAVEAYEKAYGSGGSGESGESDGSTGIGMPGGGILPSILQNYLLGAGTGISSLAERMADLVIGGISFVLAMIIGLVIIAIIERLLDGVNNIPVAGTVNRTFGIFAGVFKGLVIVWLILLVISLISGTEPGAKALVMVEENPFLSFLYRYNGLTYVWALFFGK
jgi:hypothetical protein